MVEGFDIVCIATSDWEQPWGSRQQIMSRLASSNKILFVEYQMSILHLFKFPQFLAKIFAPRTRYISNNLVIYRPWLNLPFRYYNKSINFLNQCLLLFQLKRLIKRLGFSKILFWIFEPTAYFLIGKLKEQISVYHCIDSYRDEVDFFLRKRCIADLEERLCRKCDLIFTSTLGLLDEKAKLNKNTYLLPSAVNESFFHIDNKSLLLSEPETIKKISRPRIGFIGTIDNRIDNELIDFIAEQEPSWSIILIGLLKKKGFARSLRIRDNVHILGQVDNNLLPVYINSFDIGIIPYKVNDFTRGISPIKVFEYLAFGKPVVATELLALHTLKTDSLIRTAVNKQEFREAIREYLMNVNPKLRSERIGFAMRNTWQNRVETISEILSNHLKYQETNNNAKKYKFSVIIPIYNEENILNKSIESLIRNIESIPDLELEYEIIICENGSCDNSYRIAQQLSKRFPMVRVEHLAYPSYGQSLKLGINAASYEKVVIFNIDFWDIGFLKKALVLLDEYDCIIGSKVIEGAIDGRPLLRRLITRGFNFLLRILYGFKGTDTHGIKGFKKSSIYPVSMQCLTDREIFDTELLLRADRAKLSVCELPVTIREVRLPRLKLLKRIPSTIQDLFRLYLVMNNNMLNSKLVANEKMRIIERERVHHDLSAPDYDRWFVEPLPYRLLNEELCKQITSTLDNKVGVLLEIGGGTGALSVLLNKTGYNIIAIDISLNMLVNLRKKNTNIPVIQANALELPIRSGSISNVVISQMLHHLPEKQVFFKELKRILADNSTVFIFEPQRLNKGLDWIRRFIRAVICAGKHTGDEGPIDKNEIITALKDYGFSVLSIKSTFFFPISSHYRFIQKIIKVIWYWPSMIPIINGFGGVLKIVAVKNAASLYSEVP